MGEGGDHVARSTDLVLEAFGVWEAGHVRIMDRWLGAFVLAGLAHACWQVVAGTLDESLPSHKQIGT